MRASICRVSHRRLGYLVWRGGIIYPLMAIAGIYLLYLTVKRRVPPYLIILFAVNLAANLLFTPIQLGLTALWPASVDILVVLSTLVALQFKVWHFSRLIFWLLVPYLLWGAFATVLQLTITATNVPITQRPGPIACTMEAKLCPDGSAVGRIGPKCEFSSCPTAK